jgi:hypothetical protein
MAGVLSIRTYGDSITMSFYKLPDTSAENFLSVARTTSWFNNTFDYRTVSKWCDITEKQGRTIFDRLIKEGVVTITPNGAAQLTVGKLTLLSRAV